MVNGHCPILAEKALELDYVEEISHTYAGHILQKDELKPPVKRGWCIGPTTNQFIAKIEMILCLNAQPHDPFCLVVCLDERSCFLVDDVLDSLTMKAGQLRKEHYAYVPA
jgi:hypothetical protein